jgi:HD-GYP domain-containing protein (c-di-GMP phosphodiesterase class II)
MRFSTRTFLFSSAPNIVLLIAAFFFIENLTVTALTNDAKRSLRQTQLRVAHSHARSQEESNRLLRIVSENAPLKAAMQLMAVERDSPDAKRTLEEQLREICEPLDLGFLSVSYPDGRFMAGLIQTAGDWTPLEPGRLASSSNGFAWVDGAVYTVTANRVMQAGEDLGRVSVGRRFDLREVETPAVLIYGGRVLLSTAPSVSAGEIERRLNACDGRQDCQLRLANTNYLFAKLDGSWDADGCALISLENLDAATGPVASRLRGIFLTAGIAALGCALLGSLLSARAIGQPLAIMISHLRASEKRGDLSEFDSGPGTVKEVRELTEGFNRAASAIRKSKEDLQSAYLQFTGSLASALDARDSYTAGHSHRVSEYSCAIARGLGLSAEEVADIRIGALLHDIGKIGISDSVLQKPGRLTGEEFALIQQHPTIGRRILEGVNGFQPYLAVVELHHENQDGSGYPHGLSGEEVPLAARIVHVADAFDAMTSDRPYRRGMSVSEAFAILNRFAGTQFDPEIVTAFLNLGFGTSGLMRLLENVNAENTLELKTA